MNEPLGRAPSPPPYEVGAILAEAAIRNPQVAMAEHIVNDQACTLTAERQTKAIYIPQNGVPTIVNITIDYKVTKHAPFVRVHHERFFPIIREPLQFTDIGVTQTGVQTFNIRAFRTMGSTLPVNRTIHHDRQPVNAWRGDVLVLARGLQYFYADLTMRQVSAVLKALDDIGDCSVTPIVSLEL